MLKEVVGCAFAVRCISDLSTSCSMIRFPILRRRDEKDFGKEK
jgi:hypothetical protein